MARTDFVTTALRGMCAIALLIAVPTAHAQPVAPATPESPATQGSVSQQLSELRQKLEALENRGTSETEVTAELKRIAAQLERLERQRQSFPDLVQKIDQLEGAGTALRTDVERLRTDVASVEQPAAVVGGGGGAVSFLRGFNWATSDGQFKLRLGGYMQFRYELLENRDLDDLQVNTLAIRRGRFSATGAIGDRMRFKLLMALLRVPVLHDYFVDYEIIPEFNVRIGQQRSRFTRGFIASSTVQVFLERSAANNAYRYDRSPGAGVQGTFLNKRIYYYAGLTNGSGRVLVNDNVDFAYFVRSEVAVLGKRPGHTYGDFYRSRPTLVFGAGGVYDLKPVTTAVAGIDVGQTDVDNDGSIDNIRVVSASADVLFRWAGFEAVVEGLYRHENWGAILDHPDNFELGDALDFNESRNYLGIDVQASYFVLDNLLVGARFGHSRQPLLLDEGRVRTMPPRGDRLVEFDGIVQLYNDRGQRSLGLNYTYFNWNNKDGSDVLADSEHRVILETQFRWE